MFLTSKLLTCFIDSFILKMSPQSVAYLLNGSEHLQWILDLEDEVHSIWYLWKSGLQECKGNGFSNSGGGGISFRLVPKNINFLLGRLALPISTSLKKLLGGCLMSTLVYCQPTIIGLM